MGWDSSVGTRRPTERARTAERGIKKAGRAGAARARTEGAQQGRRRPQGWGWGEVLRKGRVCGALQMCVCFLEFLGTPEGIRLLEAGQKRSRGVGGCECMQNGFLSRRPQMGLPPPNTDPSGS